MPHARARAAVLATALAAGALIAPAQPASAMTAVEKRAEVVRLVNQARATAGCPALKVNSALTTAAQRHATDMATNKYFGHTSQDGRTWDVRIRAAGYTRPGGENIAYGFSSASGVMHAWMNSAGHRKNILNCSFVAIGVGYAWSGNYWVQDFGR